MSSNVVVQNPEKKFLKTICTILKGFGLANCWYEANQTFLPRPILRLWSFVSLGYMFSVTSSEILSNFRPDLTIDEKSDAILFSLAHPVILFKVVILYFQKEKIRILLNRMVEDVDLIKQCAVINVETVKKFKKYCFILCMSMYTAIFTGTVHAIRIHFIEGIPVRTLVTYWPTKENHGLIINILRFFINFHWWYIVTVMLAMDSLSLTSLIYLESKFRQLQQHFRDLKVNFLNNTDGKNPADLERDMIEGFFRGVQFHAKTLWCADNLQNALGNIYSAQVIQSISLLAMCLVKHVSVEHNFTTIVANMAFISCMVTLTGAYMTAAGDITHEAALVSDAMFACGWELGPRGLRPLLVLGIQRAHTPVMMSAFGIFDLSYRNFISVIRSSYSFFAIMY